jgi:solute carrier family 10 (sodium/bile acid cotransporter), member 7
LFKEVSVSILVLITIGVLLLFVLLYAILLFITKKLNFSEEDKITTLFCGSKKSLVHGTVFSNVMFKGSSSLGIILLPIMIYHALQIVIISFIAQKYGSRNTDDFKKP